MVLQRWLLWCAASAQGFANPRALVVVSRVPCQHGLVRNELLSAEATYVHDGLVRNKVRLCRAVFGNQSDLGLSFRYVSQPNRETLLANTTPTTQQLVLSTGTRNS
jgi:hypothetical protein